MKKFLVICILLTITACSGEHSGYCIPNDDPSATTASGKTQNSPEEIFKYIKKKKIISSTIQRIRDIVIGDSAQGFMAGGGAAENMFMAITSNPSFISAIMAAFTLAVLFYGLGVATGIIQAQLGDAVIRVGKILAVAYIATNWSLFYSTVGSLFMTATDEIIGYMMQSFGDLYVQGPSEAAGGAASDGGQSMHLFDDLDIFFAQIFSIHTVAIISALISPFGKNAGPYSNIYAIFLLYSMTQIMTGILKVVLIYAFSLFAKALLFAMAPIFFTCMLFNQTKHLFDAWLKLQINYTLQPVFVMALLGIFISVLGPLFKEIYALKVCYQAVDGEAHHWVFQTKGGAAHSSSVSDTPPISLQSLMMLFFFSWMFTAYIALAEAMSLTVTQSVAGNLGATANAVAANLGMGGQKQQNNNNAANVQKMNQDAARAQAPKPPANPTPTNR